MASSIHNSGSYIPFIPWGKLAGTWYECKIGWVNDQGVWKKWYQKTVTVTLTTQNNVTIQSLSAFSSVWTDPYILKKVVVPNGVTIGSTTNAYAMRTGSSASWAGDLVIEIQSGGVVQGIGGTAGGGVGGSAIWGNYASTTGQNAIVNNAGTVRAGGGGGGTGGQGGQGLWYSGRTVTEGPAYNSSTHIWKSGTANFDPYTPGVWWAGVQVYAGNAPNGFYNGGWNYYVGSTMAEGSLSNETYYFAWYQVYRQTTVYDVPNYTSGGAGGAGGKGQGHDSANASGSAGSAGGTNSGVGGTGGTGGTWGNQGSTGSTGNSGNYGAGSAGSAGALAGYYKYGSITFNNTGTAQGRSA